MIGVNYGLRYQLRESNTNGDVMLDFVKEVLVCWFAKTSSLIHEHTFNSMVFRELQVPVLPAGTIVVMDNAKYHGDEAFLQELVRHQLIPCFLPAYRFGSFVQSLKACLTIPRCLCLRHQSRFQSHRDGVRQHEELVPTSCECTPCSRTNRYADRASCLHRCRVHCEANHRQQ